MGLIRVLLVLLLLLCPAGASATPTPAPAPATGLQMEEICIGVGTNSKSLACLANLSMSCLGASAVTAETAYLACFIGSYMTGQCLSGPRRTEKSCIGIDINDERMIGCLGLVGWSCQGSSFGDAGFIACFLGKSIKCAVYK